MIHLEITEFYADLPVVPGSIARAIESARTGKATSTDEPRYDRLKPFDAATWRPLLLPNSKSTLAATETNHSSRMPIPQEPPRSMPFRRDPSHTRPSFTPGPAPGTLYSPSSVQAYESTTSASVPSLQNRAITPSSKLPLTLTRKEDEAVYRRMHHSERSRMDSRHTADATAIPRPPQQQWMRGENARHLPGDLPLPPVRNVKILPRDTDQPRPPHKTAPRSLLPQAGPTGSTLISRAALVQPLPPSPFTAQMHIPPFRAGVGQE